MTRTRPHGWEIPGVSEITKRQLKAYAALRGLTLAQALAALLAAPKSGSEHSDVAGASDGPTS